MDVKDNVNTRSAFFLPVGSSVGIDRRTLLKKYDKSKIINMGYVTFDAELLTDSPRNKSTLCCKRRGSRSALGYPICFKGSIVSRCEGTKYLMPSKSIRRIGHL